LEISKIVFAVFMFTLLIWRGWETRRRQGSVRGSTSMRWSLYALMILTTVVFLGTAVEFWFVPRRPSSVAFVAGLVLFGLSHLLRLRAIRTLDQFWSLHIEIRASQELMQEGVYGWVRHPAYAAFILEHIAIPLAASDWYSLGAALLLYTPMLLLRMRMEEAALINKFGDKYRDYQRRVGALVPGPAAWSSLWRSH
jgi:protein-S-isoprenylcysteine O-methyltransferase Ste14